jgi:hypothetical protein
MGRARRTRSHFRLGQFLAEKFQRADSEDGGQSLDGAGPHVLPASFHPLIPFQIRAKQDGHLFLRQVVLAAQFTQARGNKFKEGQAASLNR